MPQLKWNETDFLTCLEVEPRIDEYETEARKSPEKVSGTFPGSEE